LKQLSSLAVRLGAVVVACGVYIAVADISGLAQQAQTPAPGAGAAPGQGAPAAAGQGQRGGGGGGGGGRGVQLGDGPWEYGNGPNRFRVSVITKGIDYPWGIAFLPDGDLLVTGRGGTNPAMHVIRKGVLDPTPLSGLPKVFKEDPRGGGLGGLLDVILHPQFAKNRLVYWVYSKAKDGVEAGAQGPATTAVARGRWDGGSALTDVKDIFVADAWLGGPAPADSPCGGGRGGGGGGGGRGAARGGAPGAAPAQGVTPPARGIVIAPAAAPPAQAAAAQTNDNDRIALGCSVGPTSGSYGARLAWDKAGLLYVSLGDRNTPKLAQEPSSHIGKILRIRDDGSVPPDNPFVGRAGWKPEIYSYGHRNPLGLWYRESTGELWSTEEGPQGGDELNLIKAGRNYGWPLYGLGRNYDGSIIGRGFSGPDIEDPVVFWVPAIAISGLSFYEGDKFPAWRNQAFVGAMRNGTGQFIGRVTFNARGLPTARDHSMLADLRQRIREVKPGPDGNLYVLTDHAPGAVLKIEPVTPPAAPAAAPSAK
jgi:glucose/arabinose dehydrogenase